MINIEWPLTHSTPFDSIPQLTHSQTIIQLCILIISINQSQRLTHTPPAAQQADPSHFSSTLPSYRPRHPSLFPTAGRLRARGAKL